MKQEVLQKIISKATVKKDGVYSYERVVYSVKDGSVRFLSDTDGTVYQFCYGFLSSIGKTDYYIDSRRKAIIKLEKTK